MSKMIDPYRHNKSLLSKIWWFPLLVYCLIVVFLVAWGLFSFGKGNLMQSKKENDSPAPTAKPTKAMVTSLPTTTPAPTPTVTQEPVVWTDYDEPDWNCSLAYPSRVEENSLYLLEEEESLPNDLERVLLLADDQLSTTQISGPEETFRVVLWRTPAGEQSFDEWAALMSLGMVDTLIPDSLGTCQASTAESEIMDSPWIILRWVNTGNDYLGLVAEGTADREAIKEIINSFIPAVCKP